MPVRLLRGSFQSKSQFHRQSKRKKKESPTIGPGLPIHLSDDFWNTMWGAVERRWGYKSHCLLKKAVFTSSRTIAKKVARQIDTSAGTVREVDRSSNDQLRSPRVPQKGAYLLKNQVHAFETRGRQRRSERVGELINLTFRIMTKMNRTMRMVQS